MEVLERQTDRYSSVLVRVKPSQRYWVMKRIIDLAICLLSLPFLLVLMLVIAVLIVLDSPGGPFFIQERVGKDGRRFRMYKFRTLKADYNDQADRVFMQDFIAGKKVVDAQHLNKVIYKPIQKEKITRMGKILRSTSLDELPQVINVLLGEMSLVGPRPNVPWEVDKYCDWHRERLKVLPGITGMAQINGRSGISFEEIAKFDIDYVHRQSLKLDLQILWRTAISVMDGDGAG